MNCKCKKKYKKVFHKGNVIFFIHSSESFVDNKSSALILILLSIYECVNYVKKCGKRLFFKTGLYYMYISYDEKVNYYLLVVPGRNISLRWVGSH